MDLYFHEQAGEDLRFFDPEEFIGYNSAERLPSSVICEMPETGSSAICRISLWGGSAICEID